LPEITAAAGERRGRRAPVPPPPLMADKAGDRREAMPGLAIREVS
jgi:hypothetical protein